MRGFSFGSYYAGKGPLYRMDPRAKLACGLVFLLLVLAARSFAALVPALLLVCAGYGLSRIPVRWAVRSMAPLLGIVVLVSVLNLFTQHSGAVVCEFGPLCISEGSVRVATFMGVRLTLMMAGMSLITLTTTTLDLTAGFERLLSPLARFGVPAHELGMMLGIAFGFMPQFADEIARTIDAQASRGARAAASPFATVRMLGAVSTPMFASVFRHAENLSFAMDARCYHGEQGCSRLHPLAYGRIDLAAGICMAVLLAGVIALDILVA